MDLTSFVWVLILIACLILICICSVDLKDDDKIETTIPETGVFSVPALFALEGVENEIQPNTYQFIIVDEQNQRFLHRQIGFEPVHLPTNHSTQLRNANSDLPPTYEESMGATNISI